MNLNLDHIYIVVTRDAPEIKILEEAGLFLAPDREIHDGQGTASVFFYFHNFYLEFIWVDNPIELQSADKNFIRQLEGKEDNASPFGIGLARLDSSSEQLPFETSSYNADWMKPGTSIENAVSNDIHEPQIFVVPEYMSWRKGTREYPKILESAVHPAGMKMLTGIRVSIPDLTIKSSVLATLENLKLLKFTGAENHLLELTFDNNKLEGKIDCRSKLPLIIYY